MRLYTVTIIAALISATFAAQVAVQIINFSFQPQTVTVQPGDTVIWTNSDTTAHTVTTDTTGFDSGNINPGATFSHTFATAATVKYHCSIHPFMLGTVDASAAPGTSASPTSSSTTSGATASPTTTSSAAPSPTTTAPPTPTQPSSGNVLNAPIKALLAVGVGAIAFTQFL
ncbi:hypothetical protein BGZ99_004336 [Dissophora globulifera]|uniref:Blue (type 1) copper domain-containing protein n=1 Tax=Dissophora globulifera TaxID=979702 RepID=A0A9P6RVQ9_9FUNG|nr:hypothetical protein BGZ99_004336 [Dissophora globulifera]